MEYSEFCKVVSQYFGAYYSRAWLSLSPDQRNAVYFPTGLVLSRFGEFYALQTVGMTSDYKGLAVSHSTPGSIESYLGQFENAAFVESPYASLGTPQRDCLLDNFVLGVKHAEEAALSRFPHVAELLTGGTRLVNATGVDCPPVRLEGADSSLVIRGLTIVNSFNGVARLRQLAICVVYRCSESTRRIVETLRTFFPLDSEIVYGLRETATPDAQRSAMLESYYDRVLTPGSREIDLGLFLRQHEDILKEGMGYVRLWHEPYLNWEAAVSTPDDIAINPDMLAQRHDGSWDIVDLKLPLLKRPSLIADDPPRRRPIAPIVNGFEQLASYARYFDFPENPRGCNQEVWHHRGEWLRPDRRNPRKRPYRRDERRPQALLKRDPAN
jgi:hypothetical protein